MELAKLHKLKDTIIVEFNGKVKALSSTVYGSGFKELTHVVFKTVDKNFNDPNPKLYARKLVHELSLPLDSTAVFLTAVDVVREHVYRTIGDPIPIMVIATIGLSNLTCINGHRECKPSTINILVVIGSDLTDNALVDLIGVVNSAKALALSDIGLTCNLNKKAFATATDAVVVAGYPTGNPLLYGGPATTIGSMIAKLVHEIIFKEALKKINLNERFKHIFGLSPEELKNLCLKVYEYSPIPNIALDKISKAIDNEISKIILDPNIWSLAIAFRELECKGSIGAIPYLIKSEYMNDSPKIIADELLGMTLSIYINGWKGLFCYYWVERLKSKIKEIKSLPMFTDDLICSLIGAILSRVYDKFLHE